MLKTIKKYLLIALGTLALALGVIGIFLPVLPTTPFLLLSAFCYMRSSGRLYAWLLRHKILGAHIYNYMTYRAVLKSTKVISLVFLWAALLASVLILEYWHVRAALLLVGIGVSIHLFTLKTVKKDEFKNFDVKEDA